MNKCYLTVLLEVFQSSLLKRAIKKTSETMMGKTTTTTTTIPGPENQSNVFEELSYP